VNGRWEHVFGSITTDPGQLGALVLRLEVTVRGQRYQVTEVISDRKRRDQPEVQRMHLDSMVYDLDHAIGEDAWSRR